MTVPCVLYVQHVKFENQSRKMIWITGTTYRKERIIGRVTQQDAYCPVTVDLTIDGVTIDAPDDLGNVLRACDWVTRQVEDLGHFVVDVKPR